MYRRQHSALSMSKGVSIGSGVTNLFGPLRPASMVGEGAVDPEKSILPYAVHSHLAKFGCSSSCWCMFAGVPRFWECWARPLGLGIWLSDPYKHAPAVIGLYDAEFGRCQTISAYADGFQNLGALEPCSLGMGSIGWTGL